MWALLPSLLSFCLLPFSLLTKAQPTDDREIAVVILVTKVGQQTGPLADHHEQATPAGVIFLVRAQVLGQLGNPGRQESDLHLRRARIGRFAAILINDLGLAVPGNRHYDPRHLRRVPLLPKLSIFYKTSVLE